jgi:CRP-like cAMP-binding protein
MELEDDIGKLASNPAFAVIEPEALRLIPFLAGRRLVSPGRNFQWRVRGAHRSIAMDTSGHGAATARIVRPPGLIGELALLTETRRPATAIAREPSTVPRISRQLFHLVLLEIPGSTERLRHSLSASLGQFIGGLGSVREILAPDDVPKSE